MRRCRIFSSSDDLNQESRFWKSVWSRAAVRRTPKKSISFSLTTDSTKNTSIPTKGSLTTTATTTRATCCQPSRSENHCWFCEQQYGLNSLLQRGCCWNQRTPDKNPNTNGRGWNLNKTPVGPSFSKALATFYSSVSCLSQQDLPFRHSD